MHVDDRIGLVRVETRDRHSAPARPANCATCRGGTARTTASNSFTSPFDRLSVTAGSPFSKLRVTRETDVAEVDGVEASRRGLREMRERHRRKSETRRRGIAQEGRPQHEQRVVGADFIERCVECGDEERIPERAPLACTLIVAPQPGLERECPSPFDCGATRSAQDDKTNAQFFPGREVRIGREGRQQMKRRR